MRVMRIIACLAVLVALAPAAFAQNRTGTCTKGVPITSTSCVQVFPAQDVAGGRHYLLLQCVGGNNCFCAIGTNGKGTANAGASTDGMQIGANGLPWIMRAYPGGATTQIPVGDVCCITAAGNSEVIGCDW